MIGHRAAFEVQAMAREHAVTKEKGQPDGRPNSLVFSRLLRSAGCEALHLHLGGAG